MDRQQKTNSNSRSKLPLILIIGAVLLDSQAKKRV